MEYVERTESASTSPEKQATPASLLTHLKFNGNAQDIADAGSTVVTNNPQFDDGALVLNGKYRDLDDEVFRVETPGLNYADFSVAVRFKADSLDGAILCGGPRFRWMVVEQPKDEKLTIRFGRFNFPTISIEPGKWYDLICSHHRESGIVRVWINGLPVEPMQIGKRKFDVEGTPNAAGAKVWMFRNPENAYTFHGLIDEFIVFDRALSDQEAQALKLGI